MSFRSKFIGLAVLMIVGYSGSTGLGQYGESGTAVDPNVPRPSSSPQPKQPPQDSSFEPQNSPYSTRRQEWSTYPQKAGARAEGNPSTILRRAADAVHAAKADDETTAARKKLTELIEKYFEDDIVQRQKELAELEKRLAKLREQLDRRRTKKQDIVELQAKVLLNEADGLGFFSGEQKRSDFNLQLNNNPFGISVGPPTTFVQPPVIERPLTSDEPLFGEPVPSKVKR